MKSEKLDDMVEPNKNRAKSKLLITEDFSPFSYTACILTKSQLKMYMKKYPQFKEVKDRIEGNIKRDAGKELWRLREFNGGEAQPGDAETVAKIYNTLGFPFITKQVVLHQAAKIAKTSRKYNAWSIKQYHGKSEDGEINSEADIKNNNENLLVQDQLTIDENRLTNELKSKDNLLISDETNDDKEHQHESNEIQIESDCLHDTIIDGGSTLAMDSMLLESMSSEFTSLIAQGAQPLQWTEVEEDIELEDKPVPIVRNKGGRPKGSTTSKRRSEKSERDTKLSVKSSKLIQELTSKAAQMYLMERIKASNEGKPVPSGTLGKIMSELEKENGLPPKTIKSQTVLGRVSRNNPSGKAAQRTPILEPVEPKILAYCVQLARMSQSLSKDQVANVTQTLVRRNNLESHLLNIKRKRKWVDDKVKEDHDAAIVLGTRWFQGFMSRYQDEILEQIGHELRFVNRHFNLRLEHFRAMYDIMYENMVRAGVAEKLQWPVLVDVEGCKVTNENRDKAYGLPTKYRMSKAQYILYVDELGYTDKEVHDKGNFYNHVDGQLFSLPADSGSGIISEMQFSVYCFSDGNGDAVMCAVILMSEKNIEEIPLSIRYGIDSSRPLQEGQTETELFERNHGSGQAMQGGPECYYAGKRIPTFVGTSSTGKLNSDILLRICMYLDEINLYDRSSGLKPLLLLDGHGSVFEASFLDYISDIEHEWVVSCGLHPETHLLQIANSHEFNAKFKSELIVAKEKLLDSRTIDRKQFYPSDIMPLINASWTTSFGLPESCKKPIAMRGWNPLSYALLLHPDLNKKEYTSERKKPITIPNISRSAKG